MTLDPYRAPATTLDQQLDLMAWMTDRGVDHLRWLDATANRNIIPSAPAAGRYGDWALDHIVGSVRSGLGGWTLWVSQDAGDLIAHAAQDLPQPDGMIEAGTIPQPSGTLWCAGEPSLFHDDYPVRALSWSVRVWPMAASIDPDDRDAPGVFETPDGFAVLTPCVGVVIWPWLEVGERLPELRAPIAKPIAEEAAAMIPDWDPAAIGDGPGDVKVGAIRHSEEEWLSEDRVMIRWWLAAMVLCGQVLPRHVETASRAQRRRARRIPTIQEPDWGEVHVTTLRRANRAGTAWEDETPEEGGRYSHQWVVSGHWRWQACGPGRKDRRLTWIAPHLKGPEDAPLMEVEQVGKLIR